MAHRTTLLERYRGLLLQAAEVDRTLLLPFVASNASSTPTISPISQSREVMPAAIASVVRSVLWMRTKL